MDTMYCINMYVYYLEQICHYEERMLLHLADLHTFPTTSASSRFKFLVQPIVSLLNKMLFLICLETYR